MRDDTEKTLWIYTAKYARALFVLDARLSWPLLLLPVPPVPWFWKFFFIGAAAVLGGLLWLFDVPVPMAFRAVKARLRGSVRWPRRPKRRFTQ
ncbi:MAG: hypothetical protein JNM60_09655 [Candidatus Competibacteraceae bacterium]|nr:hypothetical protein [Candidatus Competibacteraceae bacterium]